MATTHTPSGSSFDRLYRPTPMGSEEFQHGAIGQPYTPAVQPEDRLFEVTTNGNGVVYLRSPGTGAVLACRALGLLENDRDEGAAQLATAVAEMILEAEGETGPAPQAAPAHTPSTTPERELEMTTSSSSVNQPYTPDPEGRVDLELVVAGLGAQGIPAWLRNSSGGTATVYIGQPVAVTDGETIYPLVMGPGYFDGQHAYALTEELTVGTAGPPCTTCGGACHDDEGEYVQFDFEASVAAVVAGTVELFERTSK
jgi:hypothetical protein